MQIGVPTERSPGEARVAVTPETVKRLKSRGYDVRVETGAGVQACITDNAFLDAGASMTDARGALACDLVLKVRIPSPDELRSMRPGATLVGMLDPFEPEGLDHLARAGLTSFALEAAPRTSRAQSMDVLSSQANIAGYKAVVVAAARYPRFFPMLMTAAGTVKAAKVVVLGVGVAGLQAIATAKRLGASVEACDVRPSVKEQVESLGAKFIDVPCETDEERTAAEGSGGYARPMPQSWLDRQRLQVAKQIARADIVITTALIPGRLAPVLITEEMVKTMRAGSVIVDLAASNGGNCPLTVAGETVKAHGVSIVGETDLPAQASADASSLYARNVLSFLNLIIDGEGKLHVPMDDDIVAACLVTHQGNVTRGK
ncbi:Re/Si-specific NAD(P)(+) transhydrogenase subunit alpha [Achromobacter pestifer]|uniref:NAD(P) transhydrogenase subunit alpha part 1 n=1 Tax=Achromobacter pestifer TaxID=1353889 RepID=A0A7D4HVW3_9BURK|nr:Re/Si-specific NAD(P)(+) transhydrogenase subunit alpha [Achromobacter pestifer]QKH39699.1 Re/Si-specific NAD(P)(+) transhydrogenase subunit alpha [Achromobacter pestifer]